MVSTRGSWRSALAVLGLIASCDEPRDPCTGTACADASTDASVDAATDSSVVDAAVPCYGPPGLYGDSTCTNLATGLVAYTPQYGLWSDGVTKQRFVYLPPAATIDTSDPDGWVYPVGTRLYKNFDVAGKHVETRMLEKVSVGEGAGSWQMRTFAWNVAQNRATEVLSGMSNVLGTAHDIPPVAACPTCHASGMRDVALSFTAIQLNHANAGYTLGMLNADGHLSQTIATTDAVVPGNATEKAALGYLHANCGPCHTGASAPPTSSPLRFWVPVGTATVAATPTYTTAVGVTAVQTQPTRTLRIAPPNADASMVVFRMSTRDSGAVPQWQMPPLATDMVDANGVSAVSAWIASIPP